jgi:hypothetical protein
VSEVSRWSRPRALLRILAAIALLVCAVLTTRRTLTFVEPEPHETCPERLSLRYEPLKRHLPASGVIGYVGPELTTDGCNAKFVAQYVLAPLLVSHVWEEDIRRVARRTDFVVPLKPPLVVVDQSDPQAADWVRGSPEFSLVMDFGDGLQLYGRAR